MKKTKKVVMILSVFIISLFSVMVKFDGNDSTINENPLFERLTSSLSGDQPLNRGGSFGIYGWSKQGDSITYDYSTSPSANIEVWALDEGQAGVFMSTNELTGVHLIDAGSASGVFFPGYESKWYILFIKFSYGSTTVSYTVDFSPCLIISNPSSSTTILTDSDLLVGWESQSISEWLTIELYKGSTYQATLQTFILDNGIENVRIPDDLNDGTDYRIKISGQSSGEYDFSSYFTILKRKIDLSQPRNDDVYVPHTTERIDWVSRGTSSNVKIDLYLNATPILEIENNYTNLGWYHWEVWQGDNYSTVTDSNYQIRVQDIANPNLFDFSSYFTITNEKYLTIISPVGNTSYSSGDIIDIRWETDTSAPFVSIDLIMDNTTVLQISPSTYNDGSFEWEVPSNLRSSADYSFRVSATDNSAHAYSEIFTIVRSAAISGYLIPLLITGIFLIALCISIQNYKKILNKK